MDGRRGRGTESAGLLRKPPGDAGDAGLGSALGRVRGARPLKPLNGDLDLLNAFLFLQNSELDVSLV